MQFPFQNTYAALPDRFYAKQVPQPVRGPKLLNILPDGSDPLAMAYAGHQFGGWSPQLGDGRALLLGEVPASNGKQLWVYPPQEPWQQRSQARMLSARKCFPARL